MAETIEKVQYFYTEVADKPGEGAKVFNVFKDANLAFSAVVAFPKGRRAQLDFVAHDPAAFKASAKKAKIKLVGPKSAFLIQGDDCAGVIADITNSLAEAGINITAIHAVAAGNGRYGALLWVKPSDLRRAARLLIDAQTASKAPSHNI